MDKEIIKQNCIQISAPEISEELKNNLIKKVEEVEKKINQYFIIFGSLDKKILTDLETEVYECERQFNHIDVELKPYSKFIKIKYNHPYLKSKTKLIRDNFQQLETAFANKILNNITNEEAQKLLPKDKNNK